MLLISILIKNQALADTRFKIQDADESCILNPLPECDIFTQKWYDNTQYERYALHTRGYDKAISGVCFL